MIGKRILRALFTGKAFNDIRDMAIDFARLVSAFIVHKFTYIWAPVKSGSCSTNLAGKLNFAFDGWTAGDENGC
jgi:hypothetical protein